jgi:tRNA uridine 5-carbamoylmethylation protein Kti12
MARLIITRGLPGSGKTTLARKWVSEDRAKRARVNRDDIRNMLDDGVFQPRITESRVILVRDEVISSLLEAGIDVICDDTNLPERTVNVLKGLAEEANVEFSIEDLTGVPLRTCLSRNARRTDKPPVPEKVIRDLHDWHIVKYEFILLPSEGEGAMEFECKICGPGSIVYDLDAHARGHGLTQYAVNTIIR